MQAKFSVTSLTFWTVCEELIAYVGGDLCTVGTVLRVEVEGMDAQSVLLPLFFVSVGEMGKGVNSLGHFLVKSIVNLERFYFKSF